MNFFDNMPNYVQGQMPQVNMNYNDINYKIFELNERIKKLEQRDWAILEEDWADAYSAPGGEVIEK